MNSEEDEVTVRPGDVFVYEHGPTRYFHFFAIVLSVRTAARRRTFDTLAFKCVGDDSPYLVKMRPSDLGSWDRLT